MNSMDPFAGLGAREFLLRVRRARGGPGSRLVRELVRVERLEFAQLLLEAAVIRLVALVDADGVRVCAARAAAALGFLQRFAHRRATWSERAHALLWARLGAGADHDEFTFLARLLDEPRARPLARPLGAPRDAALGVPLDAWPLASAIAEHARLVHEGPVAAAVHARALELEGDGGAALLAHVAALDRASTPRQHARAVEGLARVHLRAGRPRTALAPIVHHGDTWPFSRVALARAFASALALRDDRAARQLGRLLRERGAPQRTARAVERAGAESAVDTRASEGLWR